MRRRGCRRRPRKVAAASCIWLLLALAAATTACGAGNGFCQTAVLRDYYKPLKHLPAMHPSPLGEHLPFAPPRIGLSRLSGQQLQVGAGERGFTLSFDPYETNRVSPSRRLDWQVTARLVSLDKRGKARAVVGKVERRVERLRPTSEGFHGLKFDFDLPGKPAVYRLEIAFESKSGKRLGRFGEYIRVLRPSLDVGISLNATSYHRGETLRATLENRGGAFLSFGLSRLIEYWDGNAWTQPVAFPGGPVPAIGLLLGPGESASCWSVAIPPDAVPGTYRFLENLGHSHGGFSPPSRNPLEVSTEFTVME